MGQVIVGPWNKLDLLKGLLERETERLRELIEHHKALRLRRTSGA